VWPQETVLFQTDDPVYGDNYQFRGFLNNFFNAIDEDYCSFNPFNETDPSSLDPVYPHSVPGGYQGQRQCGTHRPTNVISISYSEPEADLPVAYQRRQCLEIMKLGLQGITVVVSSGDTGVQGRLGSMP
jgi:tripeptidyl-peptidase-1